MTTELAERFWAKVNRRGPDDCWLWTASLNGNGYGRIASGRRGGRTLLAHRVAYELIVSQIPEGLVIDHLCRNRTCVNPAHLEPVTQQENSQRGAGGRMVEACLHGHAYTPSNTYVKPNGCRDCRACRRERDRSRRASR